MKQQRSGSKHKKENSVGQQQVIVDVPHRSNRTGFAARPFNASSQDFQTESTSTQHVIVLTRSDHASSMTAPSISKPFLIVQPGSQPASCTQNPNQTGTQFWDNPLYKLTSGGKHYVNAWCNWGLRNLFTKTGRTEMVLKRRHMPFQRQVYRSEPSAPGHSRPVILRALKHVLDLPASQPQNQVMF